MQPTRDAARVAHVDVRAMFGPFFRVVVIVLLFLVVVCVSRGDWGSTGVGLGLAPTLLVLPPCEDTCSLR